ncbi:MAG: ATP-binding protein, partial [Oscillospiraceae bacterium]
RCCIMPVFGDRNRLRQVFVNVIDNAIKYSPENTAIKIDVLQDGVNAFVNIEDCGSGIDVEDLENVKQKFFKGKGAVRGSGIGLAVVDEIITAHGGLLTLQSEEGHGTAVTVRLPIYTKPTAQ